MTTAAELQELAYCLTTIHATGIDAMTLEASAQALRDYATLKQRQEAAEPLCESAAAPFVPFDPSMIPKEIYDAARKVELFFLRMAVTEWKLGGIESRDYPTPPLAKPATD